MTKATKTKGRKQPANVVLGKSDDEVWGFFAGLTTEQLRAFSKPAAPRPVVPPAMLEALLVEFPGTHVEFRRGIGETRLNAQQREAEQASTKPSSP